MASMRGPRTWSSAKGKRRARGSLTRLRGKLDLGTGHGELTRLTVTVQGRPAALAPQARSGRRAARRCGSQRQRGRRGCGKKLVGWRCERKPGSSGWLGKVRGQFGPSQPVPSSTQSSSAGSRVRDGERSFAHRERSSASDNRGCRCRSSTARRRVREISTASAAPHERLRLKSRALCGDAATCDRNEGGDRNRAVPVDGQSNWRSPRSPM